MKVSYKVIMSDGVGFGKNIKTQLYSDSASYDSNFIGHH